MRRRDFLKGGGAAIATLGASPANAQTDLAPWLFNFFCRGQPKRRRSVHALLGESDDPPVLRAYARAVSQMKALPDSDPHSWNYQANMHGTTLAAASWPADAPFSTCQHFNEFFLAWHRMYLYHFERICRVHAKDESFALPYWDYTASARRALPAPFRVVGSTLYDGSRNAAVNAGAPLPVSATSATQALGNVDMLGAGAFQETLESTPHGAVHVSIGGNMGNFAGAARDPIFWLHHSNIDRLWEAWLVQGDGRVNPVSDANWMDTEFTFMDEWRNPRRMSAADILFSVSQLDYQYDSPSSCVPNVFAALSGAGSGFMPVGGRARTLPEEALVATDVTLGTSDATVIDAKDGERIARSVERTRELQGARDGTPPPRQLLVFEDVESDEPLNGYYEVYVGVGEGEEVSPADPRYVGNLVLFGADAASRGSMGEMTHRPKVLDATEALSRLATRGAVGDGDISVFLKPVGPGDSGGIGEGVNARVGTIVVRTE